MQYEEKVVLNGLLKFGKEAYADSVDFLDEKLFSSILSKTIFSAFENFFNNNKEFNLVNTVSFCLNLNPLLTNAEIEQALNELCPDTKTLKEFVLKLFKKSLINDFIYSHKEAIHSLSQLDTENEISEIFNKSEQPIFDTIQKYQNKDNQTIKLGDYVDTVIDYYAENPTDCIGLPLPWPEVNNSIGGGMRPGVHLFGARPKTGKSMFGVIAASYLANNEIPVLFLDTEMSKEILITRSISNTSQVLMKKIETGKFTEDVLIKNIIYQNKESFKNIPFYYRDVRGKPFDEILSIIRRWIYLTVGINKKGMANQCAIVYDYFKLMDSSSLSNNINESQAMGFQVSSLSDFTGKYGIPCLSFVQLNRSGINKEETDTIFGSDKLLHLCNSFSILKKKTYEEILKDGPENGNRKLITLASRYGGEHEYNQYINMQGRLSMCSMLEIGLSNNAIQENNDD